jgi:hypothetical protein
VAEALEACPPSPFPRVTHLPTRTTWPRSADVVRATGAPLRVVPATATELATEVSLPEALKRQPPDARAAIVAGDRALATLPATAVQRRAALESYRDVASRPTPDGLGCYARYRMAETGWALGELEGALGDAVSAVRCVAQHPASPGAAAIGRRARGVATALLARTRPVAESLDTIRALLGEPTASPEGLEATLALGDGYADAGKREEALRVYDELVRHGDRDARCEHEARRTRAILALRSGNATAVHDAVVELLDQAVRFRAEQHPDAARRACVETAVRLATETAVAWHVESAATDGVRGSGDKRTSKFAGDLYSRLIGGFTDDELAVAGGRAKLSFARADLLDDWYDWERSAPAYEELAASTSDASVMLAATVAAEDSFSRLFDRGSGRTNGVESGTDAGDVRLALVRVSTRLRCLVSADGADEEARRAVDTAELVRAQATHRLGRWEESAVLMRALAFRRVGDPAGKTAAARYAESLRRLAATGREACHDDLARDLPELRRLHACAEETKASPECAALQADGKASK